MLTCIYGHVPGFLILFSATKQPQVVPFYMGQELMSGNWDPVSLGTSQGPVIWAGGVASRELFVVLVSTAGTVPGRLSENELRDFQAPHLMSEFAATSHLRVPPLKAAMVIKDIHGVVLPRSVEQNMTQSGT